MNLEAVNPLENFVLSRKNLAESYHLFLQKRKNFSSLDFTAWLVFFDELLIEKNKKQKQLCFESKFMKSLNYKASLLYNRVKHGTNFSKIPWWNQITENLFLGALPLKKHLHPFKNLGISAVLSLVESFEHQDSFAGKPLRLENYLEKEIQFFSAPSPDFRPMSLETIYKGALFVNQQIKNGAKVHVHCKAGRSRSAAVVVAYLVLFSKHDFKSACELVKSLRPHIDLINKSLNIRILNLLYKLFYHEDLSSECERNLEALIS